MLERPSGVFGFPGPDSRAGRDEAPDVGPVASWHGAHGPRQRVYRNWRRPVFIPCAKPKPILFLSTPSRSTLDAHDYGSPQSALQIVPVPFLSPLRSPLRHHRHVSLRQPASPRLSRASLPCVIRPGLATRFGVVVAWSSFLEAIVT